MLSQDKMSRRKCLKYAGAVVAVGAVAAAGYGISQYYRPPAPTPSLTTTTSTSGGKKKVKIGGTKPLTGQETLNGISEKQGNELGENGERSWRDKSWRWKHLRS